MGTGAVLSDMEAAIADEDVTGIKPLPIDRFLAASCMQKAIRQGNVETAERAALTLWMQDKRSFWRRTSVISKEDCGVSAPDAIVWVLSAANAPAWRANNDLKVGLHLVRLMCRAVKLRLADEVFSTAANAPQYQQYRQTLAKADDKTLADLTLHTSSPLPERTMALWFLAGTQRYPHDNMPKRAGSLETAAEVLRYLGAPQDLTTACINDLKKSPWPLSLFTPLLWTAVYKQPKPTLVWFDDCLPTAALKGIPLCGLDMFTRPGKACFAQFQKAVPEIGQFTVKQIGLGVFYREGVKVNKLLTSERLKEFKQAGEIADIEAAGLDMPRYMGLRDLLDRHADTLENIRRKQLRAYLNKPQGELFGENE